jgi:light-regulated signal transduction histidine kinase (bacteriophytochrome)
MVRSYAELLAQRYRGQLDENANEFLNFILEGATGMQALIRTLLEYAQTSEQALKRQYIQVEAVLAAVLRSLQPAIEEAEAEVSTTQLPSVNADPVQLEQVLLTLVGNALKYRRPEVRPRVEVQVRRQPQEWLFSVADNGIGVDPRFYDRIFQPLKRLHGAEIPGTGIGLAVCKKIVERHGGRIWVESEPGRGSTFLFTLPR